MPLSLEYFCMVKWCIYHSIGTNAQFIHSNNVHGMDTHGNIISHQKRFFKCQCEQSVMHENGDFVGYVCNFRPDRRQTVSLPKERSRQSGLYSQEMGKQAKKRKQG